MAFIFPSYFNYIQQFKLKMIILSTAVAKNFFLIEWCITYHQLCFTVESNWTPEIYFNKDRLKLFKNMIIQMSKNIYLLLFSEKWYSFSYSSISLMGFNNWICRLGRNPLLQYMQKISKFLAPKKNSPEPSATCYHFSFLRSTFKIVFI